MTLVMNLLAPGGFSNRHLLPTPLRETEFNRLGCPAPTDLFTATPRKAGTPSPIIGIITREVPLRGTWM
jgi:hypothetical protein